MLNYLVGSKDGFLSTKAKQIITKLPHNTVVDIHQPTTHTLSLLIFDINHPATYFEDKNSRILWVIIKHCK